MSTVHGPTTRPSTRTATACPAIVTVPVRSLVDALAVTDTWTLPFPRPLPPLTIDIHARSDVALHAQPSAVVTAIDVDPPDAGKDRELVDRT